MKWKLKINLGESEYNCIGGDFVDLDAREASIKARRIRKYL